jgi:hypothetical protein
MMRWMGPVASMGEEREVYRVLVGNLRGRDQWGDPGVDWRIILRLIFRMWDVEVWTGWSWLRIGTCGFSLVNAVMNLQGIS